MINQSDDFILFTMQEKDGLANFGVHYQDGESWEILLNLAIHDPLIRETFRNIITTADNYRDTEAEGEP